MNRKIKKSFISILTAAVFLSMAAVYLLSYYKAVDVDLYFENGREQQSEGDKTQNISETVRVTRLEQGYFFDGPGEENALIFYPGARVATEAYAPIMHKLAEEGVDCFLINMPFHMAFLGINRAEKVLAEYEYDHWYMGGHSLGGAMAASFLSKHTDEIDGLLLLAAYTTSDLSDSDLTVLTVYGSEDGVLNRESLEKGRGLLPADSSEMCILGGNHAQFGSYGKQKGDGEAMISMQEQIEMTVQEFMLLIQEKRDEHSL